jgi:methylmalonyl-CoA mutase N-terminal domain/subunit
VARTNRRVPAQVTEEEIVKVMADIERSGGVINAIEQGIIQRRIALRARTQKPDG